MEGAAVGPWAAEKARIDFTGKWTNQRLSEVNLVMAGDGSLSGTYHSKVGGPITSAITGKANGDQLMFFLDWSGGSMTTWAGQLLTNLDGTEVLETVWRVVPNARRVVGAWITAIALLVGAVSVQAC